MNSVLNPEAPEFHPHLNATVQDGYLQTNKAIRTSNTFPIGTPYELFKTFTNFNIVTCKIRENVVVQSNQIIVKELPSVNLKCHGDNETNTEKIIDTNDSLLDRININIDNLTGVNEASAEFLRNVKTAAWNRAPVIATIKVNGGSATLIGAKNIPRPQLSFKDPVDNSEKLFVPRISDKPNNIKPLALTILYNDEGQPVGYEHPYNTELELYTPPEEFLVPPPPPDLPPPVEQTPLTLVETERALDLLVAHLDQVREIAVDLEHHSYRTYQGITCLIQISTDEGGDFIIDALALREHIHKLNHSFTDPNKVKVFHGAESDIQWLQRDFGVYVVGLFDTHQAARALHLTGLSLKYLLRRYCQIDADKTYQLADWRMRPLPTELVQYARTDTHYLLYMWRAMRRELPPAALQAVFDTSRHICAKTYNKEAVTGESHMPMYVRSKKRFNAAQMTALRLLFRWRDQQARELDESTTYLLPNHMLLALAEGLPREVQGLHAICCPMPPFVRQHIVTLHRMILSCRELPEEPQLFRMPHSVLGMVVAPRPHQRDVHDLRHLAKISEEPINLEAGWEVAEACAEGRAGGARADLRAFDDAAVVPAEATVRVPPELAYIVYGVESRLNADAQMFVPPYDRYRIYRAISQPGELKEIKQKEAKVAALSKGDELIREEVLVPLQRAHEGRASELVAEVARPPPDTGHDTPAHKPEDKYEVVQKKKASQRKRKIIEKLEQKEAMEQTGENKSTAHKGGSKEDADVKPFLYKNVNYKKFYSENDKGHKQPKMKFKKS